MTETCSNCGRLNRPGARFCASCQAPLGGSGLTPPPTASPTRPPAAPLATGQELDGGRYRVLRPLGRGGMGAVYLVAQTRAFDRPAVIKEVIDYFDPNDPDARQRALERFEAEARVLGELRHPGIPDLYAYFTEGGHNYLVMEYIEGPNLAAGLSGEDRDSGQAITGGPLPAANVLHYAAELCSVLEYLASRQPPVVHNDIKPANIIVDKNGGRAVLVDFGTAKTSYLAAAGSPDRARTSVYGTVGYAAPELYRGQSEPKSDVYSLAATAYHLLTDDDPGDHPGQYPLLDNLPPALAQILRAALAESTARRLDAGEFRQRLETYQTGQTGPLAVLSFPDGDTADDRDELLSMAVKHWHYTAGLLQDGTLTRWLRGALRDGPAAQAAEAATQRWPVDPDAALDEWVRQLKPTALPPAKMEVKTRGLAVQVGQGQKAVQTIEVANTGRGPLRARIESSQPWLRLRGDTCTCAPGSTCRIDVEIDATALPPGHADFAAVTLTPAGSKLLEVVPVQIVVVGPAVRVQPAQVDFGTVDRRSTTPVRQTLTVSSAGPALARCRVTGAPDWLSVRLDAFDLPPGGVEQVALELRPHRVPGRGQEATLTVAVEGGQAQQVVVSVRVKGGGLFG